MPDEEDPGPKGSQSATPQPYDAGEESTIVDDEIPDPQLLVSVYEERSSFQGPLPPPEILDGYERVVPGAAREILDMAKIEGEHRRKRQNFSDKSSDDLARRGQWMGFLIAVLVIVAAVFLAYDDNDLASWLVLAPLLWLVITFVYGKSADVRKKEIDVDLKRLQKDSLEALKALRAMEDDEREP